ncbi:MAG: LacI family DNA-binding transcriptional regulator [Fusobacteriaceae bacterium]|nr:LacI family DNA-binding transcriptional regulator [Fusobacteriaceae bacterium]
MKVTIKEVAKMAGVSVSSVSNVINGVNKCSEETRLKILDAMDKLDYRPNLIAKSLVQRKSNLIGVIYKKENYQTYRTIIKGIERYIRLDNEFDFLTMTYENINAIEDWIRKRNLDGVILVGNFPANILNFLYKINQKIVCVDNYDNSFENIIYINAEDTLAAYLATEALIKSGVQKPYFIGIRKEDSELVNRRLLGYLTCLEDYGIEFEEQMHLIVPKHDFLEGKLIGSVLQSRNIEGVICSEDILALGILKTLYNFDISCPKQIKVIGIDNVEEGEFVSPALSTVDTGSLKKGEKSCEILLKLIENVEIKKNEYTVSTKIILRETI